jgi:hypothetical protein
MHQFLRFFLSLEPTTGDRFTFTANVPCFTRQQYYILQLYIQTRCSVYNSNAMRYKFCDYENETNQMQYESYTVHITIAIIILVRRN